MSGRLENDKIRSLLLKDLMQSAGKQLSGKSPNSKILKNSSGQVRAAKKKFGSGRVAGTRQGLFLTHWRGIMGRSSVHGKRRENITRPNGLDRSAR